MFVKNGYFLPFYNVGAAATAVGEVPAPVGGPPTYVGEIAKAVGALANPVEVPSASEGGCPISEGAERRTIDEVTAVGGKLQIALLEKGMKPAKVGARSIPATADTREQFVKLEVTKTEKDCSFPVVNGEEWLILQFAAKGGEKPFTSRVVYDAGQFFTDHSH